MGKIIEGKMRRVVGDNIQKEMSGILRNRVSKENKKEYDNEKRAKELHRRGFKREAIAGMMQIPEHHVDKMVRHQAVDRRTGKPTIILDGDL